MADFRIDNGIVDGKTIAQWTQEWWKWALDNPVDADHPIGSNPLSDTSGALAGLNNNQSVFFIAGENFLPGPVTREFNVPVGKPLLVPLENFVDSPPEALPGVSDPILGDNPRIRSIESYNASQFNSHVTRLFATIDGQSIPMAQLFGHLVNAPFFDAGTSQPDSMATLLVGAPAGTVLNPVKSTGYWLMIDNLAPGTHTLHFGGNSDPFTASFGAYPFGAGSQDVTDTIHVVAPSSV
jgi:hypothetical protein